MIKYYIFLKYDGISTVIYLRFRDKASRQRVLRLAARTGLCIILMPQEPELVEKLNIRVV